jgi:hypothetical protein
MKSIKDKLKELVNDNFRNVMFFERTEREMMETLNAGVHHSTNMRVFPKVSKVEVTNIDEAHDEVKLLWSDLEVKGIITWRKGQFPDGETTYSLVSFT